MVTKQDLENVLKRLQVALDALPKEHEDAGNKLRELVDKVFGAVESQPAEEGRTDRALVALALGVIEARRIGLSYLPVPEYDLWLPFKAGLGLHSRPPVR